MTENSANSKSERKTRLILTNDSAMGRITVDMEAFFDFSFWMAEELTDLVQHHRYKYRSQPSNSISRRSRIDAR